MHLGWIAAKDSIHLVLAVIPTDVFVYITVVNIFDANRSASVFTKI